MRDMAGSRGNTIYNIGWPETAEFTEVAAKFSQNAIDRMLEMVWQAYASFKKEVLSVVDVSLADEELERSITQTLEPYIHGKLSGDESYDVQHGRYELETRSPAPAQSPEYDIAFFLKSNPRIMWPLEAKVMRTPANVAPYVEDINNEFLTGRYAPFTCSAAMLGYLLAGEAEDVPKNIEQRLKNKLKPHPVLFPHHHHYVSNHERNLPEKSWASGEFQCHHMIMPMVLV